MELTPFELRTLIGLLVLTWSVVVPGMATALWWFVRKDRTSFLEKFGEHAARLDEHSSAIGDLNLSVFGYDGASGINKWEHHARTLLTPIEMKVTDLGMKFDKLRLAIARAVPSVDLRDLS